MNGPQQSINTYEYKLGRLVEHLGLREPPFFPTLRPPFSQLITLDNYVESLACKSIAVESHYIDRDHMEDHSVFYSRSLGPYPNYCKRVHFFACSKDSLESDIPEIILNGLTQGTDDFSEKCRAFSQDNYLGFVVIKPLEGSPVGRTVLVSPSREVVGESRFFSSRPYRVHFHGLELNVTGLAFQQQDIGVSACATTALWSSLQIARAFEEIAAATPAQITSLASRYALPFGRAMPSEGLSLDQMCQAVQACGVSPSLARVGEDYPLARDIIYSAVRSGFAPVLIISNTKEHHAVTLSGLAVTTTPAKLTDPDGINQVSKTMSSMFVHDDRIGPYLRARLSATGSAPTFTYDQIKEPSWTLKFILVPLHGKIRLSFAVLQSIAADIAGHAVRHLATTTSVDPRVTVESLIKRPHDYFAGFYEEHNIEAHEVMLCAMRTLAMPRYLAIIRLTGPGIHPIDVLVDSTSTQRNVRFLAAIAPNGVDQAGRSLMNSLNKQYRFLTTIAPEAQAAILPTAQAPA